jgi:hypothetical protein
MGFEIRSLLASKLELQVVLLVADEEGGLNCCDYSIATSALENELISITLSPFHSAFFCPLNLHMEYLVRLPVY